MKRVKVIEAIKTGENIKIKELFVRNVIKESIEKIKRNLLFLYAITPVPPFNSPERIVAVLK